MNSQNPVIDLMRLIGGFQVSQAISVTAELGIADVLKNDALHIDAIAQATECHPRSLYRLLHMLASVGVLEELTGQHFKLTPLGECLRSDSSNKRSAWARYAGQPYVWQSWGAMMHSVKTGESFFRSSSWREFMGMAFKETQGGRDIRRRHERAFQRCRESSGIQL